MRIGRVLSKSVLATILFVTGVWLASYIFIKYSTDIWIFILIGILIAAFFAEAVKSIDNQKIYWVNLSYRDKSLAFIIYVLVLVSGLLPLKIGISPVFVSIFILFGYVVAWCIAKVFGSESLQELFWP